MRVSSLNLGWRWRWATWVTLILAASVGIVAVFIVPETAASVLLQDRAMKIRYETRNWAIHAEADQKQVDLKEFVYKYPFRPLPLEMVESMLSSNNRRGHEPTHRSTLT